jgi:hypothetical protein
VAVGILSRFAKYLLPMPQSPTAIPLVITIENTNGIILSVKFSREKKFWRASPSVRPSVFGFFYF